MKIKKTAVFCLVLALGWALTAPAPARALQAEEDIVIPPEAHEKAIAALEALGPGRGALPLSYKVLGIEGMISLGLSARSEKIQAAMRDLGAEETETDYLIELEGDVLFDFDRWEIREDAEATLGKVGDVIRAYDHKVTITGFTDSKGSESYNQELSKKRADSVRDWLAANAEIDPALIETDGKGESQPVAPNTNPDGSDNPEGRQKNRRVEIRIKK
jgi:outer membrane protein OmpA-like peptidoglycan-associated protein